MEVLDRPRTSTVSSRIPLRGGACLLHYVVDMKSGQHSPYPLTSTAVTFATRTPFGVYDVASRQVCSLATLARDQLRKSESVCQRQRSRRLALARMCMRSEVGLRALNPIFWNRPSGTCRQPGSQVLGGKCSSGKLGGRSGVMNAHCTQSSSAGLAALPSLQTNGPTLKLDKHALLDTCAVSRSFQVMYLPAKPSLKSATALWLSQTRRWTV